MGWDRGRYYTRSRKVNGRVIREYVGSGTLGQLAARSDAAERDRRKQATERQRQDRDDLIALDTLLRHLAVTTDLVAWAALLAAGYRRHNGGEWRKRRERQANTGASTAQ